MAYALIPDGYTLKKVTKLQKVAVNEKRRHDDVLAVLSNENAALGAIALGGVLASGALLSLLKAELEKVGVSEAEMAKVERAFLDASIVALPISPAFIPAAAKGTADRVSKWLFQLQREKPE
jgi:hypothetical protein